MSECRLCEAIKSEGPEIIFRNDKFVAIADLRPVTKGHTLIVPKKHIVSFFDLKGDEPKELYLFIKNVKEILDKKYSPDAYNVGINDGEAAGRSINHLHVHVIPRYSGDISEPEGGIRHILGRNSPYEP